MIDLLFSMSLGSMLKSVLAPNVLGPALKIVDGVWSDSRAEDDRCGLRPQAHKPGFYDPLTLQRQPARQAVADPAPLRPGPGRAFILDPRRVAYT